MPVNIDELFEQVLRRLGRHGDAVPDRSPFLPEDAPDWLGEGEWDPSCSAPDRLWRQVREHGFDALAYYKSRRYLHRPPHAGHWGAFVLDEGAKFLHRELAMPLDSARQPARGMELLAVHERMHFMLDVQTLMFESLHGRALYEPLRLGMRDRHLFVEEALANRSVWAASRWMGGPVRGSVADFMRQQPGAYARFAEPVGDLCAEWAGVVLAGRLGAAPRPDLAPWIGRCEPALVGAGCPEYLVRQGALLPLPRFSRDPAGHH